MLIFTAQFLLGSAATQLRWHQVRRKILLQGCALIIFDCNSKRIVKIGQQKLDIAK